MLSDISTSCLCGPCAGSERAPHTSTPSTSYSDGSGTPASLANVVNLEESQTQISSALNHAKCRSTNQSRESCSCTSRLEEQYQAAEEMSRSRKVAHRLPTYTTSSQNQLLIPRAVRTNSLYHEQSTRCGMWRPLTSFACLLETVRCCVHC